MAAMCAESSTPDAQNSVYSETEKLTERGVPAPTGEARPPPLSFDIKNAQPPAGSTADGSRDLTRPPSDLCHLGPVPPPLVVMGGVIKTFDLAHEIAPVAHLWLTWPKISPLTKKPHNHLSDCRASSYFSGRCWTRTSDPLLVRQVL